jgi:Tol biopolymer transport system component
VAPDRKLIVFASTRDDPQHAHLFCATWLGTQWSSPLALTALNSTNDDTGPAWSPDGTLLYFSSLRTGPDLLYTSSYDGSGCAGFASPALLPGMMNVSAVAPWVASTDLELLYTTEGTGNTYAIGRATRTSPSDPWVDQGALPFDPGRLAGFPSLTPDDLTIFVEDSPAPGTSAAIYRATRASRDDPFGPATPFAPLNDPSADQGDPDVSADGRTIVFASSRTGGAGGNDLYVSTCSD